MRPDLEETASHIKLLAMDVDGVLTDGSLHYTAAGEEFKTFNAKDGLGIALAIRHGIHVALITGRDSKINTHRAHELGIRYLFQGVRQKLPVMQQLCESLGLSLRQAAYIGDDLPDITILESVRLACCPADAVREVIEVCNFVTEKPGGRGAVREVTDLLIQAKTGEPLTENAFTTHSIR